MLSNPTYLLHKQLSPSVGFTFHQLSTYLDSWLWNNILYVSTHPVSARLREHCVESSHPEKHSCSGEHSKSWYTLNLWKPTALIPTHLHGQSLLLIVATSFIGHHFPPVESIYNHHLWRASFSHFWTSPDGTDLSSSATKSHSLHQLTYVDIPSY